MQKVFEKIIEKLKEKIVIEESIAKEESDGHPITHQYAANCMKVIEKFVKQAAAEYNNGWIPCSERLPEQIGWYLVSRNDGIVTTGYFFEDMTWREARGVENIAWRPLPEPYQPKGE